MCYLRHTRNMTYVNRGPKCQMSEYKGAKRGNRCPEYSLYTGQKGVPMSPIPGHWGQNSVIWDLFLLVYINAAKQK